MRTPVTSVTNLVIQIAREEVERYMDSRRRDLDSLTDLGNKFCENVKSDLEKVGRRWEEEEDSLLKQEVRAAIAVIAKNHHRSPNAIVCRINDNELLEIAR